MTKILLVAEHSGLAREILAQLEAQQRSGRAIQISTRRLTMPGSDEAERIDIQTLPRADIAIIVAQDFARPSETAPSQDGARVDQHAIEEALRGGTPRIIYLRRDFMTPALEITQGDARSAVDDQRASEDLASKSIQEQIAERAQHQALNDGGDIRVLEAVQPILRNGPGPVSEIIATLLRSCANGQEKVLFKASLPGPMEMLTGRDLASAALFLADMPTDMFRKHLGHRPYVRASGERMTSRALLQYITRATAFSGHVKAVSPDRPPSSDRGSTKMEALDLEQVGWTPRTNLSVEFDILQHQIAGQLTRS